MKIEIESGVVYGPFGLAPTRIKGTNPFILLVDNIEIIVTPRDDGSYIIDINYIDDMTTAYTLKTTPEEES